MSTNTDFVPQGDTQFESWFANYVTYAGENSGALGLTIDDITDLSAAQGAFESAMADHTAAQAAARGATDTKNSAKGDAITLVRTLTRQIQADPSVTNEQREGLGITVPDDERTSIAAPKFPPTVQVITNARLQHTMRFFNHDGGRSKPAGATNLEVWYTVGAPPAETSELRFAGLASKFTLVRDFPVEDGGQTLFYMVRWVNAKGQHSPWSETVAATIAA